MLHITGNDIMFQKADGFKNKLVNWWLKFLGFLHRVDWLKLPTKNSLQDSNKTIFIELLSLKMEAIHSTEAQVAIHGIVSQYTWVITSTAVRNSLLKVC